MSDNDLKHFSTLYLFRLHKLVTKILHLATIFLQLVTKRRLEDFLISSPGITIIIIIDTYIAQYPLIAQSAVQYDNKLARKYPGTLKLHVAIHS